MSESTIVAHFGQYSEEPPLSPSASFSIRTDRLPPAQPEAPPPASVVMAPEPERAPLEEQLRCYRLLSSEQIGQAFREGAVNYTSVLNIALEHGWIVHDDLVPVEPFSAPAAVQLVEVEPAPPQPEPDAVTTAVEAAVFLRLSNGERIFVGRFPNEELAVHEGRQLSFRMGHEGVWPHVDGRFVRPEGVVSIDVETLGV